jgi:two-component system NtrC family sensor kinase
MTAPASSSAAESRLLKLIHSVSIRLFTLLFGIVALMSVVFAYLNIRITSAEWTAFAEQGAYRTSELIKKATNYGMLLNRKDDVHETILRIAQTPGVAGVRIYDKKGVIIFSADRNEIGRRVDLQAEACVVCHDRSGPLSSVPTQNRVRVYQGADGARVLGLISAIENEPRCAGASCHPSPSQQTILGVLDVMMSLRTSDEHLAAAERRMLLSTLLMIGIIGVASAWFIHREIRVPVGRLIAGTERIAQGHLDTRIEVGVRSQIGALADSVNLMTQDLRRAREELTDWSGTLERKVVEKTEELSRAQRQIVQMEKMASLGKLSATVAHELNNPLAGILNYAKLIRRDLDQGEMKPDDRDEVLRYLDLIQKESRRCGDIVRNLLLFARPSGAAMVQTPCNPLVERATMLVRHHLELAGIELQLELIKGDDRLVCDGDQIQQALVAMLVNAVEAMPNGGTLAVRGETTGREVRVRIADTGVGIPPDVLPNIFEPFFSTKEDGGSGVGLGLAVVFGIVQRHGGRIEVDSKVGLGTTFTLVLPRDGPRGEGPPPRPAGSGKTVQNT